MTSCPSTEDIKLKFTLTPPTEASEIKAKASRFLNPFAPGDFAEKCVLKLVQWFSRHCHAIKS